MSTDSTRRRTAASTRSGWLMWMLCDRSPVASNVPRAACRSRREVALHDAALLAPRPAADHGQGHVTEMGAGQATVPPEGSAARGVVRAPLTPPSYQVPTGPRRRAGGVVGRLRRSLSLLPLARGDAMTWQETQGSLRRRPCATAPTSAWASSLVGRTPYQSDHEALGSSRSAISRPAAAGPASSCTDSRPSIVLINRHAIARGVPHADRRTALPSATGGRRARRGPPGPAGARRGTRTSSARSAPRLPDVGTWWAPRFAGTASAPVRLDLLELCTDDHIRADARSPRPPRGVLRPSVGGPQAPVCRDLPACRDGQSSGSAASAPWRTSSALGLTRRQGVAPPPSGRTDWSRPRRGGGGQP
jgi:hypothetical protein